ncbi:MAG TPA: lycopene cyclase domain-containing protein [Ktedonobacterales bacterium]|jgi:putative membrane protein
MTYADFLLIFLIAPLVALLVALGVTLRRRLLDRRFVALAGVLALVALLYMAPWDHTAAVWGLWSWAPGRTWGTRWWGVPPEEYLFCALEALLAATVVYAALLWRQRHTRASLPASFPAWPPPRVNAAALPLAGLLAMGVAARWTYLPFLLVWALPIIIIQWALGGRYLWRARSVWAPVSLALCAWFTLADAVAISAGVWRFDPRALLGPALGPVPLEEIIFYLLTSLMVTQGFIALWEGYADRQALARRARLRLAWLRGGLLGSAQRAPDVAEPHDGR